MHEVNNWQLRHLNMGGGLVRGKLPYRLDLPATAGHYANAQLDDYGPFAKKNLRPTFTWRPGTRMAVRARFSHEADRLVGTGGFGFWNAAFGDPTIRSLSLPQVVWFFYASPANHLPFAPPQGFGWFVATMDASKPAALALAPLAPIFLMLHQVTAVRRRLWPWLQKQLGISAEPVPGPMTAWRQYELLWQTNHVTFKVDGETVLVTTPAPGGPLGFVCWLDNQYLVAQANGRLRWGTETVAEPQWMEIDKLSLGKISGGSL